MSYITAEYERVRGNLPLGAWKFFFPNCNLVQVKGIFSPHDTLFIYIFLSTTAITWIWETVNMKGWGEAAEAVTPSLFQNLMQP